MPELPEIETTKRGISPFILSQIITDITVRNAQLRLPVTPGITELCRNKTIISVTRRGKYLILQLSEGYLLIHLGMSGHLRIVTSQATLKKHDHIDLTLGNDYILRYCDPRRFGMWLYIEENPRNHPLLAHLGPEPFAKEFNTRYLWSKINNKSRSIKSLIMDNDVVVGVGNIYATESLFMAGIHPACSGMQVETGKIDLLIGFIQHVLDRAISAGGTTLRDFYGSDGSQGYFAQKLQVYGRAGSPCFNCQTLIKSTRIAGRTSSYCPSCQPEPQIL